MHCAACMITPITTSPSVVASIISDWLDDRPSAMAWVLMTCTINATVSVWLLVVLFQYNTHMLYWPFTVQIEIHNKANM